MPRIVELDIDLDDASATGLASANTSAGVTFTLDGTLTSGGTFTAADGFARRLILTDAGAHVQTTATYTITGTDENGVVQTEDIAGPGASATVTTLKYFKTVTSVTIASPVAGSTLSLGTVDEISTVITPLNQYAAETATVAVDVTGIIDFTVQESFDDIHLNFGNGVLSNYTNVSSLAAKTVDTVGLLTLHATAVKLTVNSYTTGAELQMMIHQSRAGGS